MENISYSNQYINDICILIFNIYSHMSYEMPYYEL